MPTALIRIAPFAAVDNRAVRAGIDAVFWETVRRPPAAAERDAFYDLWLGQYLRLDRHLAFVALDPADQVVGYLVGCHSDPAASPRFAALSYFKAFAAACAQYPAHLHINLTAAARGAGLGGRLIDAFEVTVREAELPGFHIVTGAGERNVAFYRRAGFIEIARTTNVRGSPVLFLGRVVSPYGA